MTTCSSLLSHYQAKGRPPLIFKQGNFDISEKSFNCPTKRNPSKGSQTTRCINCSLMEAVISRSVKLPISEPTASLEPFDTPNIAKDLNISHAASEFMQRTVFAADLDPATAKLVIGILGPFLSAFGFLFILRIVMSWYPKLPVGKFPYVIAYAPTEPLLIPTRKVIPPLGGVDVTPVVWFGLVSFLNEILVGPQGLLVLLSQQVQSM